MKINLGLCRLWCLLESWREGWKEKRDGGSDRGQIIPPVAGTFSRTVIWQLSLTEMASFAEASQAPQPPAPKDAGAPGHKAPARGDKGFNSWVNTDDSFDKYRRGMAGGWGGGGQSFPAHSLSLVLCCLSSCLSNLSFLYFVFFFLQPLSVCFSAALSPSLSLIFYLPPLSIPSLSCPVWVWIRQAKLSTLCLFIYSISVTVKKKIATLGAVYALLCSWKVK